MDRKAEVVTDWKSGLPETPCGIGSRYGMTSIIRQYIPRVIEKYDVHSIADLGCGDQNWIYHCIPLNDNFKYVGYDIKPRSQNVTRFDITRELLPKFELLLCIYVLNHLKPDVAERTLKLLELSGAEYLLMSYSDQDEYATPGRMINSVHHKNTGRHEWRYGVWQF